MTVKPKKNRSEMRSLTRELCGESVYVSIEDENFTEVGRAEILDYTREGLRIRTKVPLFGLKKCWVRAPERLAAPFLCMVCWSKSGFGQFQSGLRLVCERSISICNLMGVEENGSRRKLQRVHMAADQMVNIRLRLSNGDMVRAQVIDYHSLAISVLVDGRSVENLDLAGFTLYYGKVPLVNSEKPVVIRREYGGKFVISLVGELRKSCKEEYYKLKEKFRPQLFVSDPFKLGSEVFLNIVELSLRGFRAEMSLANKYLLHGLVLEDAKMTLPAIGVEFVTFEILSIEVANDTFLLNCQFRELTVENHNAIIKYLFVGAKYPADKIEEDIGRTRAQLELKKHYGSALRIDYIGTPKEYLECLDIRFRAYQANERHTHMISKYEMADRYDRGSLILLAKLGSLAVATVRCVPIETKSARFPFEDSIPLQGEYDRDRIEYYELSKLAVLPQFRQSDVRIKIMQEMTSRVLNNKKGAFCMATPQNAKYYLQTGAIKISGEVKHPVNDHETYALYVYKTDDFLKGKNMSALAWFNFAYTPAAFLHRWLVLDKPKSSYSLLIQSKIEVFLLKLIKYFKKLK